MSRMIYEVSRTSRCFAPADFIFKIQSFSSLFQWKTTPVQSGIFESGGYKWRLCISLKGSEKEGEGDHISLFLSIADTDKLPSGWEVLVNCKLFLFNQIENEYLPIQDNYGKVWRFHCLKTEWGSEHVPMSSFSDPTNGYLINDSCAFGVEMYVIKPNNSTFELLDLSGTLNKDPSFSWNIKNYSKSESTTKLLSPEFIVGGWKWKLEVYPNGCGHVVGKSISVYLRFMDGKALGDQDLETTFKLRIRDRVSGGRTKEHKGTGKFGSVPCRGFINFLPLYVLKDPTKKYLVDDTLLLEVDICRLSELNGSVSSVCSKDSDVQMYCRICEKKCIVVQSRSICNSGRQYYNCPIPLVQGGHGFMNWIEDSRAIPATRCSIVILMLSLAYSLLLGIILFLRFK